MYKSTVNSRPGAISWTMYSPAEVATRNSSALFTTRAPIEALPPRGLTKSGYLHPGSPASTETASLCRTVGSFAAIRKSCVACLSLQIRIVWGDEIIAVAPTSANF